MQPPSHGLPAATQSCLSVRSLGQSQGKAGLGRGQDEEGPGAGQCALGPPRLPQVGELCSDSCLPCRLLLPRLLPLLLP